MWFARLFTKKEVIPPRLTVAQLIEQIRPIAVDYDLSEGYIAYDGRKDIHTDRPEWVQLLYTVIPGTTIDEALQFNEEMRQHFHGQVVPLPTNPFDSNLQLARKYDVPLFRSDNETLSQIQGKQHIYRLIVNCRAEHLIQDCRLSIMNQLDYIPVYGVYTLDEIAEAVRPVAERYGVDSVFVFGPYSIGTAEPDSDVDLYVSAPNVKGVRIGGLYLALEQALGKGVHLATERSDRGYLNAIGRTAVQIYG